MSDAAATWADAAVWRGEAVSREAFYVEFGGDRLFVSVYRPARPTSVAVLLCSGWGLESWRALELCHAVAQGVVESGATAVIPHWPGHEDSTGDPRAVTMRTLRDAVVAVTAAVDVRSGSGFRWILCGTRVGAAAVALAADELRPSGALLVQPVIDVEAHVAALRRSAYRATLGTTPQDWVFGFVLPGALAEGASVEAAHRGLGRVQGRCAAVHYTGSGADLPPGVELVPVRGRWAMVRGLDLSPLVGAALSWLRPVIEELR